jgi:hypothetical protein
MRVASNTGPESCAAVREDRGKALTADWVGQPLSGEYQLRSANVLRPAEVNTARGIHKRCTSKGEEWLSMRRGGAAKFKPCLSG